MSLFGSKKDFALITKMNRALLRDIIEQEVGYYKISLEETFANIYGESLEKVFNDPVLLQCILTRGDQAITSDDFGPDLQRNVSFAFLRQDLVDIQLVPEVGDIIMLNEDYYEVDVVRENQYFFGKDSNYNYGRSNAYGSSISIVCDAHLTRADKLGLTPDQPATPEIVRQTTYVNNKFSGNDYVD
jgi:hypothetical protein